METKRQKIYVLFFFAVLGLFSFCNAQNVNKRDTVVAKQQSKEEANRNVMLNASSATGPRQVPIGIPGKSIDVTIDEDNLPVVFYYWPNFPTFHWRADASLSRVGLYKISETAIVDGAVGYAVNSMSQLGGDEFSGKLNYELNHYGSQNFNLNLNGPLAKGWSYTASAYEYANQGTFKLGYADNLERTQMFKIGLTKKFNRGDFSILYKYNNVKDLGSQVGYTYAPFIYKGNGSIKQVPGFTMGKSSNVERQGIMQYMDVLTGKVDTTSLANNSISRSIGHDVTALFNYNFDNGMKLNVSAKYEKTLARIVMNIPMSITQNVASTAGYTYYGTTNPFAGNLETGLSILDQGKLNDFYFTAELSKQAGNHNWRVGLNDWYTKCDWTGNSTFYFQESAALPSLLASKGAGTFFQYNASGEAYNGHENKLALYATDDWNITDRLNIYYGAREEYQNINVDNLPYARYAGFHLGDTSNGKTISWVNTDNNYSNLVGTASVIYKLTNPFGLTGEVDYVQQHNHLEAYAGDQVAPSKLVPITVGRIGVYYNQKYISLVSALTYIKKNNYYERDYETDPADNTQNATLPMNYNVKTFGWTTDIVTNPFKNFNLHVLFTLQSPKYNNFKFTAFGNNYDYSGKIVTGLSKVEAEIDPSYNFTPKLNLTLNLRYFGKQYANMSNIIYFNGHWETFGSLNYALRKNVNIGVSVMNFLNQKGASGSINGSDLMTDASKYKNYMMTGTYILPFTVKFTTSISF